MCSTPATSGEWLTPSHRLPVCHPAVLHEMRLVVAPLCSYIYLSDLPHWMQNVIILFNTLPIECDLLFVYPRVCAMRNHKSGRVVTIAQLIRGGCFPWGDSEKAHRGCSD